MVGVSRLVAFALLLDLLPLGVLSILVVVLVVVAVAARGLVTTGGNGGISRGGV